MVDDKESESDRVVLSKLLATRLRSLHYRRYGIVADYRTALGQDQIDAFQGIADVLT